MKVIIIGAGSTGLLLAQGLKKAGINFSIFERETPEYYKNRERDWGMSLHWGTGPIQSVLPPKLQARIKEAANDPFYDPPDNGLTLPQYAGHSGELLNITQMPKGSLRVTRKKLRELFNEGIEIQFGKCLRSLEKSETGITAFFEDGFQASGSVLIGCDGNNSKVRELLTGPERSQKTLMGINMFNFTTKFDADVSRMIRARHPICMNTYHPKGYMFWIAIQDVIDPEDPQTWSFQLMFSWTNRPTKEELSTQEARTVFLKSIAPEYPEFWRKVLNAIPENATFGIDSIAYWEPCDWAAHPLAERATLAGDAAHPMPPYRGQGLNNALEDAALLTSLLNEAKEKSSEACTLAFRHYEQEMIPRARREINISMTAAKLAHDYENLMESPLIKFGVQKLGGPAPNKGNSSSNGDAVSGAESVRN